MIPLNIAAVVGLAGALTGGLLAAFSMGMSRSPDWPEGRPFAFVAATAAGFCAFDLALVLDVSPAVAAVGVQLAFCFGALHGVAWLRYLAAVDRRPLRASERWLSGSGVLLAVAGLVPGLLTTREIVTFSISWIGVTYRTPEPTALGLAAYGYFCVAMGVVAAGAWRRRHDGWYARLPIVGVFVLAILAVNDTLASARIISMPLLLDAGSVIVVVATSLLHQRKFATDIHRLERSSTRLEREVEARTRELLDTQAALARSDRLAGLGRLAAGVAHEINHPIAVVQHSLERLQWPDGQDHSAYVEGALRATHRIVRIVRQLVDAGRATSLEPARLEPFAVSPAIRRALAAAGDAIGSVHLTLELDDRLVATGEAGMAERVLVNLITNAAHAVESRTPGGRIEIRSARVDERVRVSVKDNGPGITAAVLDHLFEPFVSTKAVGKGSGLGLAVSQGLMLSQQGELLLVHTSDAGTEMALELAWSPAAPPSVAALAVGPLESTGIRLLIIDDEPDLREMLRDAAEEYFHVALAASVEEAFDQIRLGLTVDVVLCDLMMAGGGAEAWLARCREIHPLLAERTILMTSGPATPHALALVDAHADRVLHKPFALAAMHAMVLRLLAPPGVPSTTR